VSDDDDDEEEEEEASHRLDESSTSNQCPSSNGNPWEFSKSACGKRIEKENHGEPSWKFCNNKTTKEEMNRCDENVKI